MSEKLNGFTIQTLQADHERLARSKIAQACGLTRKAVDFKEVLYILKEDDFNIFKLFLLDKYIKSNGETSSRFEIEASQTFKQAAELLEDNMEASCYNSYGLFGPSYEMELREQKKYFDFKNPYRSLLIGTHTTNTAVEYTATIKNIFSQAKTQIIDIDGVDCQNKPGFVFGDGLQIPFQDNTFQSIHTNYLLHMLSSNNNDDGVESIKQLFKESFRVLSKNGQLILCEGKLEEALDIENIYLGIKKIRQLLEIVGFRNIAFKPALKYVNRQEMNRHFRSTNGALDEKIVVLANAYVITGTK